MNTWYICKIKYQKEDENGKIKNVTEPYLLDAVSFTDAESRIYEKLGDEIVGDFLVTGISKTNISEVVNHEDSEEWYKCKMTHVLVDEKSAKEKKVTNYFLVSASTVIDAYERLQEHLATMIVPFEIPSIQLTPILEVFPYHSNDEESVEKEIPSNYISVSDYEQQADLEELSNAELES